MTLPEIEKAILALAEDRYIGGVPAAIYQAGSDNRAIAELLEKRRDILAARKKNPGVTVEEAMKALDRVVRRVCMSPPPPPGSDWALDAYLSVDLESARFDLDEAIARG